MSTQARSPRIAVVGAGSLIGEAVIAELRSRGFAASSLHALDEMRDLRRLSIGEGEEIVVGDVEAFDFAGADLVFFCSRPALAERHAATAAAHAWVIDGTSAHRARPEVPLVVAEVNPQALDAVGDRGLVALPSSASVALTTALAPLASTAGLERVDVATYHAVSGGGRGAVDGLAAETIGLLGGRAVGKPRFGEQIAFNLIPAVGEIGEDGCSAEERRIAAESARVLGLPDLAIAVSSVRVPVFFGHGLAVHAQFARPLEVAAAAEILRRSSGVSLVEPNARSPGPTPVAATLAPEHVYIGRLRRDPSRERSLNFWVVADNVRRSAAHNAVSVAQILVNTGR